MINKKALIAAALLMVGIAQKTHAHVVVINDTSSTLQITGLYSNGSLPPMCRINIVTEYVGPDDSVIFYPRPDNKLTWISICLKNNDETTCEMQDLLEGIRVNILKETKVVMIKAMDNIIHYS